MLARVAVLVMRAAWRVTAAVLVVIAAYFAIGAALAPIAGGDWLALVGDRGDACARDWLVRALTAVPLLHAVVTPAVALSLAVAIAWLALGRAPWRDPLAVAAGFGVVWLACPYAALDVTNRTLAAEELYGAAAAAWLAIACLAPAGAGGRARAVAVVVLGVIAGSTAREIGTPLALAAIVAAAWPAVRARAPLAPAAALGLAVGAVLIWSARPTPHLGLVLDRTVTGYVHDVTAGLRGAISVSSALLGFAAIQLLRGRRADEAGLAAVAARAAWCVPIAIVAEAVVESARVRTRRSCTRRRWRSRSRRRAS